MFLGENGFEVVRVDCGVASISVRIENDRLGLYFIFLLFSLIFYGEVEDKEDKVGHHQRSHDMVTEVTCLCDAKEQCK